MFLFKRQKPKLTSYYKLQEALGEEQCPVCFMLDKISTEYLDSVIYELITDYDTRQRVKAALGFCNWHAWKLAEMASAIGGVGILYESLFTFVNEELDGRPGHVLRSAKRRRRKLRELWPFGRGRDLSSAFSSYFERERCPACDWVRFFEKTSLETLLDFFEDAEIKAAWSSSPGLCVPHLALCLQYFSGHAQLPGLLADQRAKYDGLIAELREFNRLRDHRYHHEPRGAEQTSPRRAVLAMVGAREVFASDMGNTPWSSLEVRKREAGEASAGPREEEPAAVAGGTAQDSAAAIEDYAENDAAAAEDNDAAASRQGNAGAAQGNKGPAERIGKADTASGKNTK